MSEDLEIDEEDNTPVTLQSIKPEPVKKLGKDTSLDDIIEDDAEQHMLILSMLKAGWKNVYSIDDLCKMALTHTKVLEARRKHLLQPVGAASDGNNSNKLRTWDA